MSIESDLYTQVPPMDTLLEALGNSSEGGVPGVIVEHVVDDLGNIGQISAEGVFKKVPDNPEAALFIYGPLKYPDGRQATGAMVVTDQTDPHAATKIYHL